MGELLPGYEAEVWHGIGAPKDTPPQIIEKVNTQINAALANSTMKERFAGLGGTPLGGSSGDFRKLVGIEIEKWRKVIRLANIRPD